MPCPCTVSFDAGANLDRCGAPLVFHVERGEIDGVDVAGITVAAVIDAPKIMTGGGCRLGVLVDEAASEEQAEKLLGASAGRWAARCRRSRRSSAGGRRPPCRHGGRRGGRRHTLRAGDAAEIEVEDVVPFGVENGEPAKLDGVFHPAGGTLTIAPTQRARWNVLGLSADHQAETSAFAALFAWWG